MVRKRTALFFVVFVLFSLTHTSSFFFIFLFLFESLFFHLIISAAEEVTDLEEVDLFFLDVSDGVVL